MLRERRLKKAISWRLLKLEALVWNQLKLASLYRAFLLPRVVFIGVTGSCGKTVTKELIATVLATQLKGRRTLGNLKVSPFLERTILRVKPWDDYCVVEMAIASGPALVFNSMLRAIRPQIGVVTVVGTDHLSIYGTAEAVAAHKGKLIESLPRHGTAVLNADDPLVRDMQQRTAARVFTYGVTTDAMLRAENVSARWPERLSFTLRYQGQAFDVRTQLCGAHAVLGVLSALAVGLAMGIPLAKAVEAVGTVPPFEMRLCPFDHPAGFTILRDDFKAPLWSIPAALQFMRDARARRKIIVLGTISDYAGASDATYVAVARQALEVADHVVFVGNASGKCLKAKRHTRDETLQAFYSMEAAAQHLRGYLQSGDLVLLKGSHTDRLEVIVTELMRSWSVADGGKSDRSAAEGEAAAVPTAKAGDRLQVVVGLGNPGARYDDTPHNIGYRVLDLLARVLGAEWKQESGAMVALVESSGETLCLIKPAVRMNATGPALLATGERMGFGAADCILVHDDLDLPIRSVRVRTRSGDGGHRGVRSFFQAFRTDEIRRVRVGIGRPAPGQEVEDYVLTPFDAPTLDIVDKTCAEAADRVFELLGRRERVRGRAARAEQARLPQQLQQTHSADE